MPTPLFSTYRQGENRVTSTFVAVLQRLSLPNTDRILGTLLAEDSFSLVSFDNQPKGKKSRPDAMIGRGGTVWIETKTQRNAVKRNQIKNHMSSLRDGEKLLLLTPDDERPTVLNDDIEWSNFRTLSDVIQEILNDEDEPPSEKEAFLLREFVSMVKQDGLLGSNKPKVVVVGASHAWTMYSDQSIPAYRYSPSLPFRSFDQFDRMAFYVRGEIKPLVPKVKRMIGPVNLTQSRDIDNLDSYDRSLAEGLMKEIDQDRVNRWFDGNFKIMLLSRPDDEETVDLQDSVINDKTGKNDKTVPFTYGKPRYVTLESLKKANTTTELEQLEREQE